MEAKLLSTAKIGKTHGVEGFLNIYSLSGEYKHIKKLKSCIVAFSDGSEKSLEILECRAHGDHVLLLFKDYEAPEKAKRLTGGIMKITRSEAPKLGKGEFYVADLFGCCVIDKEGNELGTVKSVFEGPQALMLEVVKKADGKSYIIPNLPVYIENKNIEEGYSTLSMLELLT